jgi:predicted phage terminase large subunit-like protein
MSPVAEPLKRIKAQAQQELQAQRTTAAPQAPYIRSFGDHIAAVYPKFPFTRHNTRLVEIGQRVGTGEIPRLLLMLPPRHFKSTIFSRFLPSWFIRRYPDRTWGQGAHSQPLAEEFGQAARDYFTASGGELDPSSAGKGRWKVAGHLGGFWGAGVGKGTGLPANFLNVDDPIKNRQEAESAAYRRQLYDWWSTVLNTREEPGCIKLITHTRWADADLIGWLIGQVEELERDGNADAVEPWHVIQMPMIAEPVQIAVPATLTLEADNREPGEVLDPDRFDAEWARRKRLNTPDRDWAALYQQRPQPSGGTVFNAGMLRFYGTRERPGLEGDALLPDRFVRKLASVDCTFKDTAGSDMVALQLWGQDSAGAWLLDLVNERLDFSATMDRIALLWPTWGFGELLVEDKANGSAVISALKRAAAGFTVHAVNPIGGKVARANAATPEFNQGRVFLPRWHPLTGLLTSQLLKFPGDTYDDQVDAVSQALNFMQGTGPMRVSTAHYGHSSEAPGPSDPLAEPSRPARRLAAVPGFR